MDNSTMFMAIAKRRGYGSTGQKDSIDDLDKILEKYTKFEKNPKEYKELEYVPI